MFNKSNYILVAATAILSAVISTLITYKVVAKNKVDIAVVDIQRVASASKDVAVLTAERNNQLQDLQKMVNEANSKIDAEKKESEKKKLTEQYTAEIRSKQEAYDQAYAAAVKASDERISAIIDNVAQREGLSVIINKAFILNGGTDITNAVIEQVR